MDLFQDRAQYLSNLHYGAFQFRSDTISPSYFDDPCVLFVDLFPVHLRGYVCSYLCADSDSSRAL